MIRSQLLYPLSYGRKSVMPTNELYQRSDQPVDSKEAEFRGWAKVKL